MDQQLHPCARCARAQRTCCQRAEILVTNEDVARIAAHTGRGDFHERRAPDDPAYLELDPADPEWTTLTIDSEGRRHVLKRRTDGDCTFLGAAGCSLPGEVRPLVCRLYPWTYDSEVLRGEDPDYCPTTMFGGPDVSMVQVLGMRREEAERWRASLYAELRAETHAHGGVS